MPRPVCITYDSTCDLTPALLERFQIRTVPLTIQTGERIFPDDGHYTSEDLYADFHRDGTLPKTSAVSPEQFKEFFGAILAEGLDIVHIDISADLSGTCQNALIAAAELETGRIHVVDSRQLSTGGGLLALQGAKLRDEGMAAGDIADELRRLAPHSDTSFVLERVYRQYITERLAGKTVVEDWAFITHSGGIAEDTLAQLTELVKSLAPFREVFLTQAGCTVSSHCGPGTLGVLFLRQE